MEWVGSFFANVLKALEGHQEAVIAFAMVIAGVVLFKLTENAYLSAGLPVVIYGLYVIRMVGHGRHQERLGEIDVQKIEARGKATRSRARKALERRRK